jgi:hypothetical protein
MVAPAHYPEHVKRLISNTEEVDTLLTIHEDVTGDGPGRRHNVEILNKSGVVLLVACWEAFVEDLATTAFDCLMNNAISPSTFPNIVLTGASKALRSDPNETKVWDLAGDGWKRVLKNSRNELLERYVGKLNTPKPKNVDELFEKIIGLSSLSSCWKWRGTTADASKRKLEKLVELRGEIAHRVKATKAVKKQDLLESSQFVARLAARTSNTVRAFVHGRIGTHPWVQVNFGNVM